MARLTKLNTILVLLVVTGCVTITPEAEKVLLHSQVSTALTDCQKVGVASGEGSRAISYDRGLEAAKVNLRHNAYTEYGADSVVLINIDTYWNKIVVKGIAYKCPSLK